MSSDIVGFNQATGRWKVAKTVSRLRITAAQARAEALRQVMGGTINTLDPTIPGGTRETYGLAIPLGILAAMRPGSAVDHAVRLICTLGVCLPIFVSGLHLTALFTPRMAARMCVYATRCCPTTSSTSCY
jgi:ABC-type antimicrobial peptide transport system permease subunit